VSLFIFQLVNTIVQLITLLVIVKVFLSYFLSPFHPLRIFLDKIIDPILIPIRKLIPPVGMVDLSPIILIIVVQLVGRLIINILGSII